MIVLLNAVFIQKAYEEGGVIVQNHNHVTGKYRGSAHQECNLNFSLNKKSFCCVS